MTRRFPLDRSKLMQAAHYKNRMGMQHMGRAMRLAWQEWKLYGAYDLPGTDEFITPADSRYQHLTFDGVL
jgi:hypothetical protein